MQVATKSKYSKVSKSVNRIIEKAFDMEKRYSDELAQVHPIYKDSARNLIHYLAFRSFDIDRLQMELRDLGLPSLTNIEAHVMRSLFNQRNILNHLMGKKATRDPKGFVTVKKASKILRKNNKLLFGNRSKKRDTRIMVTLPSTAADDLSFVQKLIDAGMNCARINCAHDDAEAWTKMIVNVQNASKKGKKRCKIAMDLAGPKLRTGPMIPGPKVIHIKPRKDDLGRVIQPARIWIAPPDVLPPPDSECDAILPIQEVLWDKIKRGNVIEFTDSRGKECQIVIDRKEGDGKWGLCSYSAYLESGTELIIHHVKQSGQEVDRVGELLPKEQFITLHTGDTVVLHKELQPGENAVYDGGGNLIAPAHISCTLEEVFTDVKAGEPIYFDDGKIEGVIESVNNEEIFVKVVQAKSTGSKLKADKGINLPESKLRVSGLTKKDKGDLEFVAVQADAINFSFVNSSEDVEALYRQLEKYGSKAGVILKIETQNAFTNLPSILLTAMRRHPIGVMIARGDLAIETGWKNFATIQQEIMRICGAAHIPDVWATQVLENLAKKGTPSRSEITDAAMAQQAECVMLNKGPYIHKAVKMLDKILRRMQRFQQKSAAMLPRLKGVEELKLSHKEFDIG